MQKKKNWPMKFGIGFAILFCLWAILKFTNTLQLYSTPTTGNSPTIKKGDYVWASRFKTLRRGNFIAFKQYDSLVGGIAIWMKRCVGMPGDTLEMKNGILFVNDENVDENYTIKNEFLIFTDDKEKFINALSLWKDHDALEDKPSPLFVTLTNRQYKSIQSILIRQEFIKQYVYPNDASFQLPFFVEIGKPEWTLDNFGPLRVPVDHYFVLGDNRHSSMDSRFVGFIKKENYVATVLGK